MNPLGDDTGLLALFGACTAIVLLAALRLRARRRPGPGRRGRPGGGLRRRPDYSSVRLIHRSAIHTLTLVRRRPGVANVSMRRTACSVILYTCRAVGLSTSRAATRRVAGSLTSGARSLASRARALPTARAPTVSAPNAVTRAATRPA